MIWSCSKKISRMSGSGIRNRMNEIGSGCRNFDMKIWADWSIAGWNPGMKIWAGWNPGKMNGIDWSIGWVNRIYKKTGNWIDSSGTNNSGFGWTGLMKGCGNGNGGKKNWWNSRAGRIYMKPGSGCGRSEMYSGFEWRRYSVFDWRYICCWWRYYDLQTRFFPR
jgi:hypothetical protein